MVCLSKKKEMTVHAKNASLRETTGCFAGANAQKMTAFLYSLNHLWFRKYCRVTCISCPLGILIP